MYLCETSLRNFERISKGFPNKFVFVKNSLLHNNWQWYQHTFFWTIHLKRESDSCSFGNSRLGLRPFHWPKSTSNLLDLLGTSLAGTLGISRGFSYPYALKYNSALYVWVRFDWLKNLLYVTNNYFRKWRLVRFLSQESGSLVNP